MRDPMPHAAASDEAGSVKNLSGQPNLSSSLVAVEMLMPFILEKAIRATRGSILAGMSFMIRKDGP